LTEQQYLQCWSLLLLLLLLLLLGFLLLLLLLWLLLVLGELGLLSAQRLLVRLIGMCQAPQRPASN
jgi:hypothetical protein